MKTYHFSILLLLIFTFSACSKKEDIADMTQETPPDFTTKFEASRGTETATYAEGIAFWEKLADFYPQLYLKEYGTTDSGYPLHLAILSPEQNFDAFALKKAEKNIILINNAIHPGEPDGVEASQLLYRNLLQKENLAEELGNVILITIPFYNIGGALNRSGTSRVNQEGPQEYGFRGNAQNLDLNRDFIKTDSKNTKAFSAIFQEWLPDVFVDTHVSNGADYQYILTNLMTQENKLGGKLGEFLRYEMLPEINEENAERYQPIFPYVNVYNRPPDDGGINQFLDLPRYSTGYTTLFHTLGFMTETHMLKPFPQRVDATYTFLETILDFVKRRGDEITQIKNETISQVKLQTTFPIQWELNKGKFDMIPFKGYEGVRKISEVTGTEMLFYDKNKPFEKEIEFFNVYEPSKLVEKPTAYIIPQGWVKVIENLKLNQIEIKRLAEDMKVEVESYFIENYETVSSPYESHYLHYNTKVKKETQAIRFRKGDYVVFINQMRNRYIVETLEPEAPDSFFNWNFFDAILQRKEGFSTYIFEAKAKVILEENPSLKEKLDEKKATDEAFAKNTYQQLNFIYQNSDYYEKSHLRYPVFRMEKEQSLVLE